MIAQQLTDALGDLRAALTELVGMRSSLLDLPDWARAVWPGRTLLEEGKNEEALDVVDREIAMGCPWWLLQGRFVAAARLELKLGQFAESLQHLCGAVQLPHNDAWDPDLFLRAIVEIAMFDAHGWRHERSIDRAGWAEAALDTVSMLTWWAFGDWYDEGIRDRLRTIINTESSKPVDGGDDDGTWRPYITDGGREIRTRSEWDDELMGLEESLVNSAAISELSEFGMARRHAVEVAELWNPSEPDQTALEVSDLLLDAYRPARELGEDVDGAPPFWSDLSAQTQLEALLVRAYTERDDPVSMDATDAALARAFAGYSEASGWVMQLYWLAAGRFDKAFGDVRDAFDKYWDSVRAFNSTLGDPDLVLEALCELALLGEVSPKCPAPVEWAAVAQSMADAEGEWSPGAWYDEFRGRIDRMARGS